MTFKLKDVKLKVGPGKNLENERTQKMSGRKKRWKKIDEKFSTKMFVESLSCLLALRN